MPFVYFVLFVFNKSTPMQLVSQNPFSDLEVAVTENVGLAPFTWYKLGGPARYFLRPRSLEELQLAVRRCGENSIPMYVLGRGANLLVSDSGVDGAVFYFHETPCWEETTIENGLAVGFDCRS